MSIVAGRIIAPDVGRDRETFTALTGTKYGAAVHNAGQQGLDV